jgi:hypothetical protein
VEAIMNEQPTTLKQRIDVALQQDEPISSADIAALIEETKIGIANADKERAVDQALLSNLQARHRQVRDQEQGATWLAEHDALKRQRDTLAEELCELYPDAVAKIVDLFVRISANDEALSRLHQARPSGVRQHLLSAELHARGLDSFTLDRPSLLTSVHLFDWDSGRQNWPPQPPPMAAAFAATMVPAYGRRYTADWWMDNEQRVVEQRAERQRMADYYARTKREQESRENAEARERFIAQQQTISRASKP